MVYSTRRFVLSLAWCYFLIVVFSPFSIAITSLWEEIANLSAFCKFVRFALVWFCLFSPTLGVWEGLRLVILALLGLFFYFFFSLPYMYKMFAGICCHGNQDWNQGKTTLATSIGLYLSKVTSLVVNSIMKLYL